MSSLNRSLPGGRKARRASAPLALFLCLCATPAAAQEAGTTEPAPAAHIADAPQARKPAPQTPARTPQARPAAPRAPQTPAAAPSAPTPVAAPAAPAPPPPREVVTVVHRLSGWKLLSWLAASGPPMLEVDNLPSALDVHTNIVAGFVHTDGRNVVARLPQGGAEAASLASRPPTGLLPGFDEKFGQSEFTLILGDGRSVRADFVGLDAATGLSLLEAGEPLFNAAGDEGHTEDPTVGQHVRLYAPAQVAAAPPATPAPPAKRGAGTDEGVIYLSIDRADARLTEITRAPSGRPFQVTARAEGVTPAWTGAVATTEAGGLVGIVAQSASGETRIVTGEMVRQAVNRVQASRASVPQPWLGVRGDAAFRLPVESWVEKGWPAESALPFIQKRQGVLLTSVPPGTPASAAGLLPGDVIARVGGRDVRGVEDLSLELKELSVGATADFTVWRSREPQPLKLSVLLKGTENPALSTAEAEARAARESLRAVQAGIRDARLEEQRLRAGGAGGPALAGISESLRRAEAQLERAMAQMWEAEARIAEARFGLPREMAPLGAGEVAAGPVRRPLQTYGLEVIGLTARGAARLGARGGVLVVNVRPDSPAASSGLLAGDIIETVNGRAFTRPAFARLARESVAEPLTLGVVRLKKRINVAFALHGEATVKP